MPADIESTATSSPPANNVRPREGRSRRGDAGDGFGSKSRACIRLRTPTRQFTCLRCGGRLGDRGNQKRVVLLGLIAFVRVDTAYGHARCTRSKESFPSRPEQGLVAARSPRSGPCEVEVLVECLRFVKRVVPLSRRDNRARGYLRPPMNNGISGRSHGGPPTCGDVVRDSGVVRGPVLRLVVCIQTRAATYEVQDQACRRENSHDNRQHQNPPEIEPPLPKA